MYKSDPLRLLARSPEYQILYSRSKDMGLKLFNNNQNFTPYQLIFLHWLQIYENLYQDLAAKESYIDEEVIGNDILTDAYLLWKSKYKDKEKKKQKGNLLSKFPSIRMRQ